MGVVGVGNGVGAVDARRRVDQQLRLALLVGVEQQRGHEVLGFLEVDEDRLHGKVGVDGVTSMGNGLLFRVLCLESEGEDFEVVAHALQHEDDEARLWQRVDFFLERFEAAALRPAAVDRQRGLHAH